MKREMIITEMGTEIQKWSFESFEQVEDFYLKNIDKWRLQNRVTKVIGKSIFIYGKNNQNG